MTAETLTLESGEYELGDVDGDGDDPWMMMCLTADGATPAEFFGGAVIEGIDQDGQMRRDYWVAGKKYCPFRKLAIEWLKEAWEARFGAITTLEIERALTADQPPGNYQTWGDSARMNGGK